VVHDANEREMKATHLVQGARVLVVDDDESFRELAADLLRTAGYHVTTAPDGIAGLAAIDRASASGARFDAVILDLYMPGLSGLEVVERVRQIGGDVPILMLSGMGTVDLAVEAMHLGADDFVLKPLGAGTLVERVALILARRPRAPVTSGSAIGALLGESPAMRELREAVRAVATTENPVFVTGEPGTGLEDVAQSVHDQSSRSGRPFITVACGLASERELDATLCGRPRGRPGALEQAHGGTIVLADVDALTAESQRRLALLLQTRAVTRVGGARPRLFDVRVVATSHRDLAEDTAAGLFRADLREMLAPLSLVVPPVRCRSGDIPALVVDALARVTLTAATDYRQLPPCSPAAMKLLREYQWPGNVAELRAAMLSAVVRSNGGQIQVQHLPAAIRSASPRLRERQPGDVEPARYHRGTSDPSERAAIVSALAAARGSRFRAAALLGMGRTTLWRKLKEYGLVDVSPPTDPNRRLP
jgi:DNA-binding NtrC family response regulator